MDNSADSAAVILAIWYCGAIPVLLHSQSTQSQVQHAVENTTAYLIVTSTGNVSDYLPPNLRHFTTQSLMDASRKQSIVPHVNNRPDESADTVASIVFTSGSSGGPKGVAQTHQSLISGCNAVFHCLHYQADDTILCPVPWSFDYGFGQLLTTLLSGITQLIPNSNSPFDICDSVKTHRPTILAGVPSLLAGLCQGLSPADSADTSSIRLITSTGSRLHQSTLQATQTCFPTASVSLNYGLTETYRSTSLPVNAIATHSTSVGLPIPGVSISIVREDGSIADCDEVGEIVHTGTGLFAGYWGKADRTRAIRRTSPSWSLEGLPSPPAMFTGDLGWKDQSGYLYIKGRKDRQIKTMGVLVNPEEIEAILMSHDQLQEIGVITKSHEVLGEMIVAVCVTKDFAVIEKREIKAFCRQYMTQYMLPREFHFVKSLPRTSSGKVDYPQLARLYSSDTTGSV